jgi:hypothetical protein
MNEAKSKRLFFDERELKPPKASYVAWVDMMGTRNAMSQSLAASANHIGRVHAAIIRSKDLGCCVYPVMDGAYITSEKQAPMLATLRGFFKLCAEYFAGTEKPGHRFLVRGGLAFGPVIHGADISAACNAELGNMQEYKQSLLFGIPMIQANSSEALAPPFGLYLDESARAFAGEGATPFSGVWQKWWDKELPEGFLKRLYEHFGWCEANWRRVEYKLERVKEHTEMAHQYFGSADGENKPAAQTTAATP